MLAPAAIIAANRFGLGARPAEAAQIAADPRGWLLAQVAAVAGGEAPLPAPLRDLPAATAHSAALFQARIHARRDADAAAEKVARERLRPAALAEAAALFRAQAESPLPFVERWTMFWANHFTVGARNPLLAATAGGFEREALRPHLFGRFADMLLAATRHPAMLLYLDNASSTGPASAVAMQRRAPAGQAVGLTENHAREILELHTVGRAAGYGQADVVALARILTGWTVGRNATDGCSPGQFCFAARRHDQGPQVLLGHSFPQQHMAQGEAALAMLAVHPATAERIATRLAVHFIADEPPPAAVAALAAAYSASGGDLRAVAETLIALPAAWAADPASRKLRTPRDWLVAAARLTGLELPPMQLVQMLQALGQRPFGAPSPAGWPDRAEAWLAPEALRQRLELAHALAQRLPPQPHPGELLACALGETVLPATHQAVLRAESAGEAVAMLLAAPDFQWR